MVIISGPTGRVRRNAPCRKHSDLPRRAQAMPSCSTGTPDERDRSREARSSPSRGNLWRNPGAVWGGQITNRCDC